MNVIDPKDLREVIIRRADIFKALKYDQQWHPINKRPQVGNSATHRKWIEQQGRWLAGLAEGCDKKKYYPKKKCQTSNFHETEMSDFPRCWSEFFRFACAGCVLDFFVFQAIGFIYDTDGLRSPMQYLIQSFCNCLRSCTRSWKTENV